MEWKSEGAAEDVQLSDITRRTLIAYNLPQTAAA